MECIDVGITTMVGVSIREAPKDDFSIRIGAVFQAFPIFFSQWRFSSNLSHDINASDTLSSAETSFCKDTQALNRGGFDFNIIEFLICHRLRIIDLFKLHCPTAQSGQGTTLSCTGGMLLIEDFSLFCLLLKQAI